MFGEDVSTQNTRKTLVSLQTEFAQCHLLHTAHIHGRALLKRHTLAHNQSIEAFKEVRKVREETV